MKPSKMKSEKEPFIFVTAIEPCPSKLAPNSRITSEPTQIPLRSAGGEITFRISPASIALEIHSEASRRSDRIRRDDATSSPLYLFTLI